MTDKRGRIDPADAATAFVNRHFPESLCAFAAGSFLRGEATPTSDIDLVILTTREDAPFRASYREHGWPIEVFAHTVESYPLWFVRDGNRPSLAFMVDEGIVVRDADGLAERIKGDARALLDRGPEQLSAAEIEDRRYGLTDILDDFVGCEDPAEGTFIAAELAEQSANLILLLNRRWIGRGKWVLRAIRRFDPTMANRLRDALLAYSRDRDKRPLINFAQEALALVGGSLFEGYIRHAQ